MFVTVTVVVVTIRVERVDKGRGGRGRRGEERGGENKERASDYGAGSSSSRGLILKRKWQERV